MSQRSNKSIIVLVVSATIAASAWLLAFAAGRVSIGVPGEWVWTPHNIVAVVDVAIPIAVTILLAIGYFTAVRRFCEILDSKPGSARFVVPAIAAAGFLILWAVQSCAPSPHRQLKPMWVLYHWGSSGYYDEARDLDSLGVYLTGFENELNKGDVLHKGTHPPGLVVANYGLLSLCRASPGLSNVVLATIPSSVAETFLDEVPQLSRSEQSGDLAALWLSVILTQLAAALTVVPLYGLLRRRLDSQTSLLVASLWPFVPGVAIFLPKSDAIYPVLASTFLLLSLNAWDKGSLWRALLAGVVFWIGMMLSLAMLPIAVLAAIHALVRIRSNRPRPVDMAFAASGILAGFAIATAVFYMLTDIPLWRTWVLNYHNHAGFYAQYKRTYTSWLLANPLELTLTVGAPLLVLAIAGLIRSLQSRDVQTLATPVAVFGTWLLLYLSGKNSGEAARLWVLLTPVFLWAAGHALAETETPKRWWLISACQALVAILSVATVNGFAP